MFSARQRLRHFGTKSCENSNLDQSTHFSSFFYISSSIDPKQSEKLTDSLDDLSCTSIESLTKASATFTSNKDHRVSFKSTVKVILIPHVSEYKHAGLANDLWYDDEAINDFKIEALHEYRQQFRQIEYSL